jgi:hypothetical protein
MYKGYHRQNEDNLNWVATLTDEDLTRFQYQLSDPAKSVPLLDYDTNDRAVQAAHNFFEKKYFGRTFEQVD